MFPLPSDLVYEIRELLIFLVLGDTDNRYILYILWINALSV